MSSRRKARRRALEILFRSDLAGVAPSVTPVEEQYADEFTRELVEGVEERLSELDQAIGSHAEGWTVARMAAVDRTVLRLAVYELKYRPDVPEAVAINEAVEAAKELSTDESGRFVNGILGQIARDAAG
ncbi:MAG: transcription antitermination factor NusB [Actinomycetota bacterium]